MPAHVSKYSDTFRIIIYVVSIKPASNAKELLRISGDFKFFQNFEKTPIVPGQVAFLATVL